MVTKSSRRRSYRRKVSRRRSRGSRTSRRTASRSYRRAYRAKRGGKHKKLSSRILGSVLPDIGLTKLKFTYTRINNPCNDLSTDLYIGGTAGSCNTISILMNTNPNGGAVFAYPGGANFPITGTFFPTPTWTSKYTKYRPMGAKVTVTVISQDEGADNPSNQVASPFMVCGFPCVLIASGSTGVANGWSGVSAGYDADTIPNMKYGFRKISPGLGGKNMVKYTTYWDFAKIAGVTREQYLSDINYACDPDTTPSVPPAFPIALILGVYDFSSSWIRKVSVNWKITQYGRWEGQLLDTT